MTLFGATVSNQATLRETATAVVRGWCGEWEGGWDSMMGYGWGYMGLFMWVVPLLLLGLLVYFVVLALRQKGQGGQWGGETPLEILKKRYARGEITKEQFAQMKEDLKD